MAKEKIIKSSGNIFGDLAFEQPDLYALKADLAMEIEGIIAYRKLTQIEAARIIGASQPDISNLKRGQLDGFTMDRLCIFLMRLNRDIDVSVKRVPRKARLGHATTTFDKQRRARAA